MHLVIFEDARWPQLIPLTLSHPTFALLSGNSALLDRFVQVMRPSRLSLWVRPELVAYCRQHIVPRWSELSIAINPPLDDQPALLLNARAIMLPSIDALPVNSAITDEGDLAAVHTRRPGLTPADALNNTDRWQAMRNLPGAQTTAQLAHWLWDLLAANQKILNDDLTHRRGPRRPVLDGPFRTVNERDVCLDDSTDVQPGCVLDASGGPIAIGAHSVIGANSVIQGPCWIGPHCQIAPLTLIRAGTSIGPRCKVAGEVSNSIILGCSNKAHYGFLGDSYVGQWVNLGAGTSTSNLKNTYGPFTAQVGAQQVTSGRQFLGAMVGDHTRTAIGTRLMGGTYAGFCTMLATTAAAPRFIPSFTFLEDAGPAPYAIDKAIEVAGRVYARRHLPWTSGDDALLRHIAASASKVEQAQHPSP